MAVGTKPRQNLTLQEKELEAHQGCRRHLTLKGLGHPSGKEYILGLRAQRIISQATANLPCGPVQSLGHQLLAWAGPMPHRDSSSCGIQELCSKPLGVSDHVFFVFSIAHFSAKEAGDLSTLFDVGGIIGEALSFCSSRLSSCLQKEGTTDHDLDSGSREKRLLAYSHFCSCEVGWGV